MKFKSLRDYPIANKRVIMRVDYNITLKKPAASGDTSSADPTTTTPSPTGEKPGTPAEVADDTRIRVTVPTIQYLLEQNCSIIILSHFKRPAGQVLEELRLDPMARRLSQLLNHPVTKLNNIRGAEVEAAVQGLKPRDILMLENTRFYPEEETNDAAFAAAIAAYGEVFVFDGFAVAHRDHATVTGIAKLLPTLPGFSVEEEIRGLSLITDNPPQPHVALLGGMKISDKVKVIEALLKRSQAVLIGGALANTFLVAQGKPIGASLAESQELDKKGKKVNPLDVARELLTGAAGKIVLPVDFVAAAELRAGAETKIFDAEGGAEDGTKLPADWMYLDIGPKSTEMFAAKLRAAKSVLWNGPMGAYETPGFDQATKVLAETVAGLRDNGSITVTGGGDTEAAIQHFGLGGRFTYSSTAGGASLKFIAGGKLPILDYLVQ